MVGMVKQRRKVVVREEWREESGEKDKTVEESGEKDEEGGK